MPSFHDLELRWGGPAAYHYLLEAEKAARIPSCSVACVDPETRLANAIRAQDGMATASRQTQAA